MSTLSNEQRSNKHAWVNLTIGLCFHGNISLKAEHRMRLGGRDSPIHIPDPVWFYRCKNTKEKELGPKWYNQRPWLCVKQSEAVTSVMCYCLTDYAQHFITAWTLLWFSCIYKGQGWIVISFWWIISYVPWSFVICVFQWFTLCLRESVIEKCVRLHPCSTLLWFILFYSFYWRAQCMFGAMWIQWSTCFTPRNASIVISWYCY